MNNRDLAKKFAEGGTSGRGSHMFINRDTIYSYGYHFPIAKRMPWGFYFNSREYSNTTSKHKAHVRWALAGDIIWCPDYTWNSPDELKSYLQEGLEELLEKGVRARKKERVINNIQEWAKKISKARELELTDYDPDILSLADPNLKALMQLNGV